MSCENFLIGKTIVIWSFLLCGLNSAFAGSYEEVGNKVWQEFRSSFPTPYRTIACEEYKDGSRVYIVSEPPDKIDISSIERVFDGFISHIWTKTTKIGYDGFLKDIIIYTDGIPAIYHDQIIIDLNILLFGTNYKSSYLSLPYNGKEKPLFYDKDYNITVNDKCLYNWILGNDKGFSDLLSNKIVSTSDLMLDKRVGVYSSLSDNIVVWCIPEKSDISNEGSLFHIFETESDFLLGAVYSNGVIMIVGRKRACDFVTVPPLRIDDILMLAAAGNVIGQSLNAGNPVYCKIGGDYDWCPAWVSDNISNSEYAYLLTLTDIYLKFWLHNYNYEIIGYNNCRPHTRFDDSLLEGISKIRYNWNTDGYAKITQYNDALIIHFNNIGCLNCNLFNETNNSSLSDIDKIVYNYFKDSHSVDILRVAQYTMLYEIFRAFNISANEYQTLRNPSLTDELPFLQSAQSILSRIKDLEDYEIDNITKKIYENEIVSQIEKFSDKEKADFVKDKKLVKEMREKWINALKAISIEEADKQNITYEQYIKTAEYEKLRNKAEAEIVSHSLGYFEIYYRDFEKYYCLAETQAIEKTRDKLKVLSAFKFQNLCRYCASPNTYQGDDKEEMEQIARNMECKFLLSRYSKYFGLDINEMFNKYVKYYETCVYKWFKAPTVVKTNNNQNYVNVKECFDLNGITTIGGHSIIYKIIEESPSYTSKGQHVLTLSGDPLGDALYYGQKAARSTSQEDMAIYIRQSREALSQEISSVRELNKYNSLYNKLERSIYAKIRNVDDSKKQKDEIINDISEVKSIAEYELANNNNLSENKKDSYKDIKEIAEREEERLKSKKDEEMEDNEIKELKERLKRLQATLGELKRNQ